MGSTQVCTRAATECCRVEAHHFATLRILETSWTCQNMSPALIFLVQALVVVALPVVVLRFSRLKGVVPLVVIQIVVGIALGPSLFGRLAPEYYQLFFNQAALAPLSGIGSVAVLVFGLITGLHLDPDTFRGNGRATSIAHQDSMKSTSLSPYSNRPCRCSRMRFDHSPPVTLNWLYRSNRATKSSTG